MEILKTTPSSILVGDGKRTTKVYGESFARGYGSPDFIIDKNSVEFWMDGESKVPIEQEERKKIIDFVVLELQGRGWTLEVE